MEQIGSSLLRSNGEGDRSALLSGGGAGQFGAHGKEALRNSFYIGEYVFRWNANYSEAEAAHVVVPM